MQTPEVGDVFEGRYQILDLLGTGGFATVFRALDSSGREVALKILTASDGQYPADVVARFDRELRTLGQLRDPHTVRLFDFGRAADGLLFMVFELIPGRDLSEAIESHHRIPAHIVIKIMRQVLSSLREAHAIGVLHRDIKPQNIRLFEYMGDPWNAKLLDFGIARPIVPSGAALITQAGELIGTPRYMSPEQLTDAPLSPSSDLYSLGLVMLEAIAGKAALGGHSWGQQLDRLQTGHLISLPDTDPAGIQLSLLISRMSARKPADRFQSADEVLAALNSLTNVGPVSQPQAATTGESRVFTVVEEPRATSRIWAFVGVAAAVALGVALGLMVLGSEPEPPAPKVRVLGGGVLKTPTSAAKVPPPPVESTTPVDIGTPDVADAGTRYGSAGCGAPPPFRGIGRLEAYDGRSRAGWDAYVPKSYDPTKPNALLFVFHQAWQEIGELFDQAQLGQLAEDHGLIIVMPPSRTLTFPNQPWLAPTDTADVPIAKTAALATWCVDVDKVFLLGHGLGGVAALNLSCEEWVSGVITVSFRAGSHERLTCDQPVDRLQFNNTEGTRMPVEGGVGCGRTKKIPLAEAESRWVERNKCTGDAQQWFKHKSGVCNQWSNCAAVTTGCRILGGHGWPGGAGNFVEIDPPNCDPPPSTFPATDVIGKWLDERIRQRDSKAPR